MSSGRLSSTFFSHSFSELLEGRGAAIASAFDLQQAMESFSLVSVTILP